MSVEPVPNWLRPVEGFTAHDLDRLEGLPPHTELIDGGLVFVSPQRRYHAAVIDRLLRALEAAAPPDWVALREMSIIIDDHQRPEPDVLVVARDAVGDGNETWYPAGRVLLAVEVVSPDSMVRDRERKPQLYARAGIAHFWRVEQVDLQPVLYTYELDVVTAAYVPTGIFHGTAELAQPFALTVDLGV